ncbi:Hpt domain-containing protein [Cardiobacteriaceae bacterium TAE3-ERU3]|nr:Hpt domain-containing protein [Cardiobacteriaceae bacterium TAE3-ERU3]
MKGNEVVSTYSSDVIANTSPWKKYRTIIISVALFLFFDLLILGLNFYYSFLVERSAQEVSIAARQGVLIQQISKNLSDINLLSVVEYEKNSSMDIRELKSQAFRQFDELKYANNLFQQSLSALKNGGETIGVEGQLVSISPIDLPQAHNRLTQANDIWEPFYGLNNAFIKDYENNNFSLSSISYAAEYARIYNIRLQEDMNDIVRILEDRSAGQAMVLRVIQVVGIVIALLLFLFIVFRALGQLFKADHALSDARRETTEIFDTVSEGLFLIDENLQIGSQHSRALRHLLGIEHIAGRSLEDVLAEIVSRQDLEVATEFIQQLFNPRVKAKLIHDLNPLDRVRAGVTDESGLIDVRYFKFSFSRVYEGKQIVRVLVSVADISKTVLLEERLERERTKNDEQVEMLTAILKIDNRMMSDFLRSTQTTTKNINNILREQTRSDVGLKEKARLIFRETHSLKGEASAIGLRSFVNILEDMESEIKLLNDKSKLVGDDFLPLVVSLEKLIAVLDRVASLVNRIGSMASANTQPTQRASASNQKIIPSHFGHYFSQFAEQVAERNGKLVKVDIQGFDQIEISEHQAGLIKDITVQLIRNAIVHGIETPKERMSKNKSEIGHMGIELKSMQGNGQLQLTVEDDGLGIDFALIREKLRIEKQLSAQDAEALTKKELLMAIFRSGFSTLQHSSEDAGRGVGMDVVRARILELDGRINIQSERDLYTRFVIRFATAS